jgi:hypothetical protein
MHFVCRLVGLQVVPLGAYKVLYHFLILLERVHPETPTSNLCFHIDSNLSLSPNGGKSAASIGLPQGAASHSQASPLVSRRQGETQHHHNNSI